MSVSAPSGCDWAVSADQPWVVPSVKSGTGIGEVSFDVQAKYNHERSYRESADWNQLVPD